MRTRAEGFGRDPSSVKVLPGVSPIVADTEEEAKAIIEKLGQFADPVTALRVLSERIGHDLSGYSLDELAPTFPPSKNMQGHSVNLARMAKEYKMTLRQLRDYAMAAQGHRLIWGTPERIADEMQTWFDEGAADGFVIMPAISRERWTHSSIASSRSFKSAASLEPTTNLRPFADILA